MTKFQTYVEKCIPVRWVIRPKTVDGQNSVKARLYARGFKDLQCFCTDLATYSREGLRITFTALFQANGI